MLIFNYISNLMHYKSLTVKKDENLIQTIFVKSKILNNKNKIVNFPFMVLSNKVGLNEIVSLITQERNLSYSLTSLLREINSNQIFLGC